MSHKGIPFLMSLENESFFFITELILKAYSLYGWLFLGRIVTKERLSHWNLTFNMQCVSLLLLKVSLIYIFNALILLQYGVSDCKCFQSTELWGLS